MSAGGAEPANSESSQKLKFIAMAFAGADLVFETDIDGKITLALGAIEQICGVGHLEVVGAHFTRFFSEQDHPLLLALPRSLITSERRGPMTVRLKPKAGRKLERLATLSAFHLAQNPGRVSCALSLGVGAAGGIPTTQAGFATRTGFEAAAAGAVAEACADDHDISIQLIDLPGLQDVLDAQPAGGDQLVRGQIAAALRLNAFKAIPAAELGGERYAIVRAREKSSEGVQQTLANLLGDGVRPTSADVDFDDGDVAPGAFKDAISAVLTSHAELGAEAAAAEMKAKLQEGRSIKDALVSSDAADPVWSLADVVGRDRKGVQLFKAAAAPPGEGWDRFAVLGLDANLALARGAIRAVEARPEIRVLIDVDAQDLGEFVAQLRQTTGPQSKPRERLIVNIRNAWDAETDALRQAIGDARDLGLKISLGDADPASITFNFLMEVDPDFVLCPSGPISASETSLTIFSHFRDFCESRGCSVIAAGVAEQSTFDVLHAAGVRLFFGTLFGPSLAPPTLTQAPPSAARRQSGA